MILSGTIPRGDREKSAFARLVAFLAALLLTSGCRQTPSTGGSPIAEWMPASENKDFIADGWQTFDDPTHAFLVRYPPEWNRADVTEPFRFLAYKESADCGVQLHPMIELGTQSSVNLSVKRENIDELARQAFAGRAIADVTRGELGNRAFVRATAETQIAQSSKPLWRKEYLLAVFTPGRLWRLHCGVSLASQQEAAASFTALQLSFEQFFKSFAVYRSGP